jgi:regulator of protease activity HflC (stomatin/prohibitin superfamily)
MIKLIRIKSYEKGLVFKDGEFNGILGKGNHFIADPLKRIRVDVVSMRDAWLIHKDLDVMVASGKLEGLVTVLDLKDSQRALVWIDERFDRVAGPGLHVLCTGVRKIRHTVVEADTVRFEHKDLHVIAASPDSDRYLNMVQVEEGFAGVFYRDGSFESLFSPGKYLFWKNVCKVRFFHVDMREKTLDISGQEIMTQDKVTLRLNVIVNYRVSDPVKSVASAEDAAQSLYRESQLAIRSVVGSFELDELLTGKDAVSARMEEAVKKRASDFGYEVVALGIRDIILPGDMKELMNRVIEARKAADATLITRREETAAMRSQANTAKLLENNPTLMRLRELEILEKIASNSKMNLILGERGLAERVVNLL